jgi:two-component system KDP operon response regulator KdpE
VEIELNPEGRLVQKSGKVTYFTLKKFDMLHGLMSRPGLRITHARLISSVWGPEYGNELEYLRAFIRQFRKKLEDDPASRACLLTDAYVGYRFSERCLDPHPRLGQQATSPA